jgi:hypothetical protein
MPFGEPGVEKLNLNYDELWEGGPFQVEVRLAKYASNHFSGYNNMNITRDIVEATPILAW